MTHTLTVFSNSGKTYLGYFPEYSGSEKVNIPGIGDINASSAYYAVVAPCEVEFELVEEPGSTSHIDFKRIMPLIPASNVTDNNTIYFAFPKATTILSNVRGASINATLTNAYKIMTGTSL